MTSTATTKTPLGLELDAEYRIVGFSKGSRLTASGLGGHLKIGDVVTAVDGYEVTSKLASHHHRATFSPPSAHLNLPTPQVTQGRSPHRRARGPKASHGAGQTSKASARSPLSAQCRSSCRALAQCRSKPRRPLDHVPNISRRGATDERGMRECNRGVAGNAQAGA